MKRKISAILLAVLIFPLELYVSYQAMYTINETWSILFRIISILILLIFLVFSFRGNFKPAIVIFFTGYIFIVPANLYLMYELHTLKNECDAIVNRVVLVKLHTGDFPRSLAGVNDQRIYYVRNNSNSFELSFYVCTTRTRHHYALDGGWSYYPD